MRFYRPLTGVFLSALAFNPIAAVARPAIADFTVAQNAAESSPSNSSKLRVGVAGEPPAVVKSDDVPLSGIAVKFWKELASELQLDYQLVYHRSIPEVLDALKAENIDVAIGTINITEERIRDFDFTQPIQQAHLTVLVPSRPPTPVKVIKPFFGWAFLSSIGLIFTCLFIVGNLIWLAEHKKNSEQFPKFYLKGVSEAMWCALVTFTTVGYGDRYPITRAGRLILGAWMLISLAAVTTLTAGIATTLAVAFSAQPDRELEKLSDLQGVRLAAISGSTGVQWAKYYRARVIPVERLSDGISLLRSNQVDGVVYPRLSLQHYLQDNPKAPYQLVKFNFGTQNYGFALTKNNPLTRKLDEKILSVYMQIQFQEIEENWFNFHQNRQN